MTEDWMREIYRSTINLR